MEEDCLKADDDEDESEDSFFVPDGYLSENEVLPNYNALVFTIFIIVVQYILRRLRS